MNEEAIAIYFKKKGSSLYDNPDKDGYCILYMTNLMDNRMYSVEIKERRRLVFNKPPSTEVFNSDVSYFQSEYYYDPAEWRIYLKYITKSRKIFTYGIKTTEDLCKICNNCLNCALTERKEINRCEFIMSYDMARDVLFPPALEDINITEEKEDE